MRKPEHKPRAGEIRLKSWTDMQAKIECVSPIWVRIRLLRGNYKGVKVREVNSRVKFVKDNRK